jgi:hypothetical protein
MSRFYDSLDSRELARVEQFLKKGGIEYTIHTAVEGSQLINEIFVAEEDLIYADMLLSAQSGISH